jgi:hypothetical protein
MNLFFSLFRSRLTCITIIFALISTSIYAQDGTLVDPSNSQTRNASAALEVFSTTQGFLAPRVALTQTTISAPVTSPALGLLIFNTDAVNDVVVGFYYWGGSSWKQIASGNGSFPTGTGTQNYVAKWNNPAGSTLGNSQIYDNGTSVGIGTASPATKLHVSSNAGILSLEGTDHSYIQWYPDGLAAGRKAYTGYPGGSSNDFTIANEISGGHIALLPTGIGNVGIGISSPARLLDINGTTRMRDWLSFGSADDIGRITWGGDRFYMNGFAGKKLSLGSNAIIDQLLIDLNGNVGINSVTPGQKLDVAGNIKLDDNMMVEGTSTARVYRNLATYNHEAGASAGVFIINTNQPFSTDCMFRVKIEGYFYDATAPFETTVAAYNYSGTSTFINMGYTNIGSNNLPVRLARNASGNIAIVLGTDGASYSYPKISVTSYHQGYGGINETYADGWTITRATNTAGLTLVTNVPNVTTLPSGSGNYIQNQFSSAQSANYWITGDARIQGNTYIGPNANKYFYASADRIIVAAESTTDVAEFASYGLYLPKTNAYNLYVGGGAQLAYATAGYIDFKNEGGISTNGGTLNMYFKNTGNVGVGTTGPGALLDVQGASGLRIGNSTYDANLVFGNNASWKSGIRAYDNGDAEMRIWHANALGQIVLATGYNGDQSTVMPTDGVFIDQNKVGIGYASPAAATGKLLVNGNVGIGTTNPLGKLDIVGDIYGVNEYSFTGFAEGIDNWEYTGLSINPTANSASDDSWYMQSSSSEWSRGTLSKRRFRRTPGLTLEYEAYMDAPLGGAAHYMIGFVDGNSTSYSYSQNPANLMYHDNASLSVYDNGTGQGSDYTFDTRSAWWKFKVVLKGAGADYYVYRNNIWNLVKSTTNNSNKYLRVLISAYNNRMHIRGMKVYQDNYSGLNANSNLGDNLGNHLATTTLNMAGNDITRVNEIVCDQNYGRGLTGVYASDRYQNIFAMSTSYRLAADGTGTGNMYGIAWTHTNVGGQSKAGLSHQALFMNAGVTQTAIGTGIWTNGNVNVEGLGNYYNFNSRTDLGLFGDGNYSLSLNAPEGVSINFDSNGNGTSTPFSIRENATGPTGGNALMTVLENGKTGIGTAAPTENLSVAGALTTANFQVKRDFATWNTTAGSGDPVHIKTNIPYQSNIMYRILVEGYNYGMALPINSEAVGYPYSGSGTIINQGNVNQSGGVSISQYYSTDGYVVIKLSAATFYYAGFSVSAWLTNPAGNGFDIKALAIVQQASDLYCGYVAGSTSFGYTGGQQSWVVPCGVTSINYDVRGAQGGYGYPASHRGGYGGRVTGSLAVTPGSTIYFYVGGVGANSGSCGGGAGGYNGGALGGTYCGSYGGGGGGGASDIRQGGTGYGNRVAVAGGGGGGGFNYGTTDYDRGGNGGGSTGECGSSGGGVCNGSGPGGGGTQSGGGGAGFWGGYCGGTAGTYGDGGAAGACGSAGGGGGGGYYGGGGGVWSGGGGGSNYPSAGDQGYQGGNGAIYISW